MNLIIIRLKMKLPIEMQNIIYQYKMDMDFILLDNQRKKIKEQEIKIKNLKKILNSIYFTKYKTGDKIININSQRCATIFATITDIDGIRDISYNTYVIQYDDQPDVNWSISGEDLYEFRHSWTKQILSFYNGKFCSLIIWTFLIFMFCIYVTNNFIISLFFFGLHSYITYYFDFDLLKTYSIISLILFIILLINNIIYNIDLLYTYCIFLICIILGFLLLVIYTLDKLEKFRVYRNISF